MTQTDETVIAPEGFAQQIRQATWVDHGKAEHAGYMANYYRWFGTPEAPFGWYYDLLALWAHVSTASIWMRLPTLLMALACWWVISREVIPRLGDAVKRSSAARWTAAGMFLAFWLPLNNGLRPEPIIALGILLTWCSVERAVATSRLLPVAIACIIGALTLFSGPTGIASIGALLVAIGPLRTILHRRSARFGLLPLLAPLLAAVTVTAILIFRDQTFAGGMQASSFKSLVGPSLAWFDEHIRYERLFMASPDGSVARRFAVLTLLVALAVSVAMTLRRGRIPGTAGGPSRRIIGITVISFLAMMFTPTKWTHHFGVFAGLAGSLGALAAVAVTAHVMRSRRNRTIFAAAVFFVMALSFASVNGWWYVSNFGVPWSNQFPQWHFGFSTFLLGLSVLALLLATYFHFSSRGEKPWRPTRLGMLLHSPLAIAGWAAVLFEVVSLTLGMTGQYPAWSVGRSNLDALRGQLEHPDAQVREVGRELAGQGRQRRLGGAVGTAGKRVDAAAGDRRHVDHAALGRGQFVDQAARQRDGREEIDIEDLAPEIERRVYGTEPRAARPLGRDCCIVHERIELAAGQSRPDLLDAAADIDRIGEIELDMILAAAWPGAERAEWLARNGDDPPAVGAELLHRCVADAAARAGQYQGPNIVARKRCIHGGNPTLPCASVRGRCFAASVSPRATIYGVFV